MQQSFDAGNVSRTVALRVSQRMSRQIITKRHKTSGNRFGCLDALTNQRISQD